MLRTPSPQSLVRLLLRRPDDWHLHLRDGAMLRAVAPWSARTFGRVLVMPNLVPPVTSTAAARAYRQRILDASGGADAFEPRMACYLTDDTDPDALAAGHAEGVWHAAKLYPAHATTNASHGVTDLSRIRGVLERMAEIGLPLCVHGEVVDPAVDVFDREAVFLDAVLEPLIEALPGLRVVIEHATTEAAVALVRRHDSGRIAATITPHHLWWNRNAIFAGGLRPHAYCLPLLKREADRQALVEAATSGDPRFFAGTDSAPHSRDRKECDHGCAGVFCAPSALPAYAQIFEAQGALDQLEAFTSTHGAAFYGLPPATEQIALVREPWEVPRTVPVEGTQPLTVFLGGETLDWRIDGT